MWIGFGMLSDRDVAPQAHTDVLAAVPKPIHANRIVRRLDITNLVGAN